MIKRFFIGSISTCWLIGFILEFGMQTVSVKEKRHRRWLVIFYKVADRMLFFLIGLSIVISLIYLFLIFYKITFIYVNVMAGNVQFSTYIALALLIVSIEPLVIFIFKMVKKNLYKENKEIIEIQGLGTDIVNKIILIIDKLPIKGFIHIGNTVIVIFVNSSKLLNIETEIASSSIYMAIATYYAVDQIIEYFKEKYSTMWNKIDNKIFETDKIDKSIKFGIDDLKKLKNELFLVYIDTGKYNYSKKVMDSNNIKIKKRNYK